MTKIPVGSIAETVKVPAKTRSCSFQLLLINVLFSDKISPKFEKAGDLQDNEIIDSGL
jgi:hypothetical protein